MVGIERSISAVFVAIALIAAQVMPAWAGCHSQRHAAPVLAAIDVVKIFDAGHHGMSHVAVDQKVDLASAADQKQPSKQDACLGNCGCACGLAGAFVLANLNAIDAPPGIASTPEFVTIAVPLGDRPDGPRRPPRITA